MEASVLQRRPDLADRAAGGVLGLVVGTVLAEPLGGPDPRRVRSRLVAHLETGPAAVLDHLDEPGALPATVTRALPVDDRAVAAARVAIEAAPVPAAGPAAGHLVTGLHAALDGADGDLAGPVAGALLGARWGASAVPFAWRRQVDRRLGPWSGRLIRLALAAANGGAPVAEDWPLVPMLTAPRLDREPVLRPLPGDEDLLLANLAALPDALDRVDAVVSLCRMEEGAVSREVEHHEVVLVDQAGPYANPHLDLVLADTADALATLRAEGRRVLLHCHAGRSRMPTVAAAHLARRDGVTGPEAFARVAAALPHAETHNLDFQRALARIGPGGRLPGARAVLPRTGEVEAPRGDC